MAIQKATVGAVVAIALICLVVGALGTNDAAFTVSSSGSIEWRPRYSTPSPDYSSTGNWTSSIVSCLFTGSGANITVVLFKTNVTGTWSSWITLIPVWVSGTDSCWGDYTLRLPSTVGTVVGWEWTAEDTNNNWLTGNSTSIYTLTTTAYSNTYSQDATWIGDAGYNSCANYSYVLRSSTTMTKLLNSMQANHIKYAVVLVSYITSSGTLSAYDGNTYEENSSTYATFISGCHARGIKAIVWLEPSATVSVVPGSAAITTITNEVVALMRQGWDGFSDDMESSYSGTLQDYIWYVNNMTVTMHDMGKLMMPAIPCDSAQDMNMHLNVDFILSMFYSTESWFEPQGAGGTLSNEEGLWAEDFGLYGGDHGAPASPLIMGIMTDSNYNNYALAYQLNKTAWFMQAVTHRNLDGFSLYQWECMADYWSDDWEQWDYFYANIGTSTPVAHTVTVSSSPISLIGITYQNKTWQTTFTQCSFPCEVSMTAQSPYISWNIVNGTADHSGGSLGYSVYTYYDGPLLLPAMTFSQFYVYTRTSGNLKAALYSSSGGEPSTLITSSGVISTQAGNWTLVTVTPTSISKGLYFIAIKPDADGQIATPATPTSGITDYWTSESYSTAWASTASVSSSNTISQMSLFVAGSPASTVYNFSSWTGGSTSTTLTFAPSSNTTITATYSAS
jgi:hypothetical protein